MWLTGLIYISSNLRRPARNNTLTSSVRICRVLFEDILGRALRPEIDQGNLGGVVEGYPRMTT